ncbi:MAG: hypothetical protein ACOY5Y_00060 [Pseudomonadota bacterium]|jgi:hypothetical protein
MRGRLNILIAFAAGIVLGALAMGAAKVSVALDEAPAETAR